MQVEVVVVNTELRAEQVAQVEVAPAQEQLMV
jgi:hypothetical protein